MKKLSINDMQDIAQHRGGKCLSAEYMNSSTKLYWQCKNKHIWQATPDNIKRGKWCPYCAGLKKKTIEEMRQLARGKGGKCLSDSYINAVTKLEWQCKDGHIWKATPDSVRSGSWCRLCSTRSTENICRAIFEKIFENKFPVVKPAWLKNNSGNRLELDGYCEKLKIAFEYQGKQHFENIDYFHKTRSLRSQIEDDLIKKHICANKEIALITIPYNISQNDLPSYIINQCAINNIDVRSDNSNIDILSLDNLGNKKKLQELKLLAKNRKGKCLSDRYINSSTKLKWQCREGHIWEATPSKIKQGQWCPGCKKNRKLTIEEMHGLAKENDGKCLSNKYINATTKLKWQCKEGHIWEAKPSKIRQGQWCPDCGGSQKLTIEEMRDLAEKKNGECLSERYINYDTKLDWMCEYGHKWSASPNSIKQGSWCPACVKRKKLDISEMQQIALSRGGKCLSEKYTNIDTKLIWQCSKGHIWEATPYNVKNGRWCHVCARKKKVKSAIPWQFRGHDTEFPMR